MPLDWFDDMLDRIEEEEREERLAEIREMRRVMNLSIEREEAKGNLSSEEIEFYSSATYHPESDHWELGAVPDPC
ncbi:MAG: hypothetical protein ACRCT1_07080 [Microcoleaceae cyanobacterium]